MNIKKSKGITIVMLVITIVIMLILATLSVKYGSEAIERAKLEDIRTNMIMIKGKAKIIKEKYDFNPPEDKLNPQPGETTLIGTEIPELVCGIEEQKKRDCYKWSEEDLNSQGLNTIKTSINEYYIVYYGDEIEIYYYPGVEYNGGLCYSLTQLNVEE